MKLPTLKLHYALGLVMIPFLIAATDNGCEDKPSTTAGEMVKVASSDNNSIIADVQEFTFHGHQYILVTFRGEGGGALCLSPDDGKTNNSVEHEKN